MIAIAFPRETAAALVEELLIKCSIKIPLFSIIFPVFFIEYYADSTPHYLSKSSFSSSTSTVLNGAASCNRLIEVDVIGRPAQYRWHGGSLYRRIEPRSRKTLSGLVSVAIC